MKTGSPEPDPAARAAEQRAVLDARYLRPIGPDPLLPLTLQILFVQVVAFPAILLVWDTSSA